ncbi:MAG: glycosyltransferase family 4 protein, partial [Candidatus Oleimicrobiaceae bacterium]
MRVLELTYSWPAETFIQRHVWALQEAGLDVRLVARAGLDERHAAASIGGGDRRIRALVMPNFDHLGLAGKLASLRHLLVRPRWAVEARPLRDRVLLAFFERLKPDLIHFHTASLAAIMRWVPQTLGIPYTVSLRGSDVQVLPLRSEEAARETGFALSEATMVHAIGQHLVSYVKRWTGGQVDARVIYNVVPLAPSLPPYQHVSNTSLRLLTIGRLHWTKCNSDLIYAVGKSMAMGLSIFLSLVGSGPDEERLRCWVIRLGLSSKVTFLGRLTWAQIPDLLNRSDAYVHSSIAEGFGNAIAEAMAWGCPVFISNACGAREIIRDGENGFLLPTLQPELWPEKLALARDRRLMERVREAAYETARQYFAPERHARDFIAFYETALRRGPAPPEAEPIPVPDAQPTNEEAPPGGLHLLVRGAWRWENGPDLILRALAPLCREGEVQITFAGHGPQEDELRYLADFMGLGRQVRFHNAVPEGLAGAPWADADIVLDISEAQQQGWRVTRDGTLVARLPFGDVE